MLTHKNQPSQLATLNLDGSFQICLVNKIDKSINALFQLGICSWSLASHSSAPCPCPAPAHYPQEHSFKIIALYFFTCKMQIVVELDLGLN